MNDTLNASEARKKFYQIMDEVNFGFNTVRIVKSNDDNVVMVSKKNWLRLWNQLVF